jgi:uncharacterized Zn finger protein (UPF0148 family)
MPEPDVTANVENAVCEKCGVDVRENTLFCYNCGTRVAGEEPAESPAADLNGTETAVDPTTREALDELAEKFKIEDAPADDKLARAAAERRRARVSERRTREFEWEPADDAATRPVVMLAILITIIAAVVVVLAVYW